VRFTKSSSSRKRRCVARGSPTLSGRVFNLGVPHPSASFAEGGHEGNWVLPDVRMIGGSSTHPVAKRRRRGWGTPDEATVFVWNREGGHRSVTHVTA
jgi:hypothetical protein